MIINAGLLGSRKIYKQGSHDITENNVGFKYI